MYFFFEKHFSPIPMPTGLLVQRLKIVTPPLKDFCKIHGKPTDLVFLTPTMLIINSVTIVFVLIISVLANVITSRWSILCWNPWKICMILLKIVFLPLITTDNHLNLEDIKIPFLLPGSSPGASPWPRASSSTPASSRRKINW